MTESILPLELTGVSKITGYRGIGKSYLAAQADAPDNIVFFDFESKGRGIDAQLNFGLYRALTQEAAGGTPVDLFNISMDAFQSLEQDRFTVAILDNVSPLELALNAEGRRGARQYTEEFGLNLKNVIAGRFGGTKAIANFMISSRICDTLHARGIRLIVAISHIGARWGTGGPIPNKYREKGADRWQELSILSLVLVPGEHAPIPAALVQKEQLGLLTWDAERREHDVSRRLPFRIPKCTFAEIRRYLREPADLNDPKPGEVPTSGESDPFSDKLSKEQIAIMRLALEKEKREQGEADTLVLLGAKPKPAPDKNLVEYVAKMRRDKADDTYIAKSLRETEGKSYKAIADALGVKVRDVRKWCRS